MEDTAVFWEAHGMHSWGIDSTETTDEFLQKGSVKQERVLVS